MAVGVAGLLVEAEGEVGEPACLGLKYLEKTKRTLLQETLDAVLRGFFIRSASEEATVYWVHSMTCHPLPLNRKSFHHHTAQNRKQQSAPSSPEKSDTSPPFPTMPHGRLLQARTMKSVV